MPERIARIKQLDGTTRDVPIPPEIPDDKILDYVDMQNPVQSSGDTPLGLRARLSFASNIADQRKTLENLYGKDNVNTQNGNLIYREREDQAFRPVNPVGFDLGDLAEMAGTAPEMVLGTIGALGGAALGGPPGAIAGGAIGGGAGNLVKQGIGGLMGVPQSGGLGEVGGAALMGGAGEGIGRGLAFAGAKLIAPFARSVTPEAKAAVDWMDRYLPLPTDNASKARHALGIDSPRLLPAEATESWLLDTAQNISDKSIIGGSIMKHFRDGRDVVLKKFADDFAMQFGPQMADPQQLGKTVKAVIEGNFNAAKLPAETILNDVERRAANVRVNIKGIKAGLKGRAEEAELLNGIEASHAGDDLVALVRGLADDLPFGAAKALRSRLISRVDEYSIANKKAPAKGLAKYLIGQVDNAIEAALEVQAPKELVDWRLGNSIYKDADKKFNNAFLRRLIKMAKPEFGGNPEGIVSSIFRPGKPSLVEAAKVALDPPSFRQLTRFMVDDVFTKSLDPKGVLDGQKLFEATLGKTGLGEKTLRSTFGPNFDTFSGFVNTLKTIQQRQGNGTGAVYIQLAQAGAMTKTALMGPDPATGAILLAPAVAAKLMTTRLGAKLLTEGFRTPKGTPAAMGIATRIYALATQLDDVESVTDAELDEKTKIKDLPTKHFTVPPLQPQGR